LRELVEEVREQKLLVLLLVVASELDQLSDLPLGGERVRSFRPRP
jgi:hypothetical protein